MDALYHVGKIVNTHGLRGELKIVPITDFPEERFAPGAELVIEANPVQPVTVARARVQKGLYFVTLKDLEDINLVERFKGNYLSVRADQRGELADDEYYFDELIGLTVTTTDGQTLGQVSEILTPGPNDVWVIPRPGKPDALIPFLKSVVKTIDLDAKTALIDLPEGLIDDAD